MKMEENNLIKDMKKEFGRIKEEFSIECSLEEFNEYFNMKGFVLHEGYINPDFHIMIVKRIADVMSGWANFYHRLIVPNPGNMAEVQENKTLDEKDVIVCRDVMNKLMELSSRCALVNVTKGKEDISAFINDSVSFWRDDLKPNTKAILEKLNLMWKGQIGKEKENNFEGYC